VKLVYLPCVRYFMLRRDCYGFKVLQLS
jgi:hypothetical protein